MENFNWDEAIDAYVDDELTQEERREVEARAKSDSDFRDELEWALKIHANFASLKAPIPEGFTERLQEALKSSPVWDEIEASKGTKPVAAETTRRADTQARRRRVAPAIVAACAVAVVAGLSVEGVRTLRSGSSEPTGETVAENASLQNALEKASLTESAPRIMTPSPAGNAPESVAQKPSQNQLWTIVTLGSDEELTKRVHEFERVCAQQNIRFTKYGGDCEFALERVKPSQWQSVAEWFDALSPSQRVTSEGLNAWSASSDENAKAKTLRVSFEAKDLSASEETNTAQ